MPSSNHAAVNNLGFWQLHGMEEVVGSIPTRSTNSSFLFIFLCTSVRRLRFSEGAEGCRSFLISRGSINSTTLKLASRFCWSTARV